MPDPTPLPPGFRDGLPEQMADRCASCLQSEVRRTNWPAGLCLRAGERRIENLKAAVCDRRDPLPF